MDVCVERNDCSDVFCTKLSRPGKLVLIFPNFSIQRGRTFFRCDGNLGGACHSTVCLVFFTHGGNLWSVPKGLHGHASPLKNTCSSGDSRCVWKVTSQRRGWAYINGWQKESIACRVRPAGYLVRWGTFHPPTGRAKNGTRWYRTGNSWAHISKPSVSKT